MKPTKKGRVYHLWYFYATLVMYGGSINSTHINIEFRCDYPMQFTAIWQIAWCSGERTRIYKALPVSAMGEHAYETCIISNNITNNFAICEHEAEDLGAVSFQQLHDPLARSAAPLLVRY